MFVYLFIKLILINCYIYYYIYQKMLILLLRDIRDGSNGN